MKAEKGKKGKKEKKKSKYINVRSFKKSLIEIFEKNIYENA